MKYKNIVLVIILFLFAFNSNAQQANYNACQMIKKELESFIDTMKLEKRDNGKHSVYVLDILDDKPEYIEFKINSFSDVHYLERITWNHFAIVDSEIVLICNLPLQSISLIQCLSAQMISRENTALVKQKLYDKNILIIGAEMQKIGIIKEGKLNVVIYPSRG
ncbi:hypothetical protein F0919_03885 [Taibaiella lutea]|uniref:Uncharacterized protein n=1 Tax=Taibaiella lutea TaxID=2608001 RepID=A0A5M6CR07_9BACT|nr:hypothetical protein [Taibaiella lutea]KAA5536820.1 hypothetical protein F0919_03885 [Taibaiella lutea]